MRFIQSGALKPIYRILKLILDQILLARFCRETGVSISRVKNYIDFVVGNKTVRLNKRHEVYSVDVIKDFNYYFNSVEPYSEGTSQIVDFSYPKFHVVAGFGLIPIHFPSLAEPLDTTDQYFKFAGLKPGDTVLDLGAYSGLTSIVFKELVGRGGRVVAVEADMENLNSLRKNIDLYKKVSGMDIEIVPEAIWNHSEGVRFSSEGNMGSSASNFIGLRRGQSQLIKSSTLSSVAERLQLKNVSFVKCDIEGAESVIFEDKDFFLRFSPRIIVEIHSVGGHLSTEKVMGDLSKFGYSFKLVSQPGAPFPLLECVPS